MASCSAFFSSNTARPRREQAGLLHDNMVGTPAGPPQTLLRHMHRLTRSPAGWCLAVVCLASTVSVLVWMSRSRAWSTAALSPSVAKAPVASLAGSPAPGPSAGGEVLPVQQRLMPQVG